MFTLVYYHDNQVCDVVTVECIESLIDSLVSDKQFFGTIRVDYAGFNRFHVFAY